MFFYSEATEQVGSTDQYFSNVSLLLKADGANNSTTFTDSSLNNLAITRFGDAKISTSQSKYGGSSAYFDGATSYLTAPNSSLFNFGTGDFTIETWLFFTSTAACRIINSRRSGTGASGTWSLNIGPTSMQFTEVIFGETGPLATFPSILNRWAHVAVSRSSGTTRLFLDGVLVGSGAQTTNFNNISNPVYIGRSDGETVFSGYLDDLRVTKGVARYTENFTPPDSLPTTGA